MNEMKRLYRHAFLFAQKDGRESFNLNATHPPVKLWINLLFLSWYLYNLASFYSNTVVYVFGSASDPVKNNWFSMFAFLAYFYTLYNYLIYYTKAKSTAIITTEQK